ncbi:MAG: hypothetical protein Q8L20_10985 [Gammaproteobacteria bacterium]|nr:hypothetical protein [Gammaproteobacteria bacterium]
MNQNYKVIFDHNGRPQTFVTQSNCPEGAEERFRSSPYGSFPITSIEVLPKRGARA